MTTAGTTRQLDLYDVAFLAGGTDRVVDAALVALVESGRARVHAPGELAVVRPGRHHPVEAAVMDAIGTLGHRSVDTIRWRLTGDGRLEDVERSLTAAGLVRRRWLHGRSRPSWSTTTAGRQALTRVTEQPLTVRAPTGGGALQLAIGGRQAMPDRRLCSEIFERPLPPLPRTAGMRRRIREAGWHDPMNAGLRAGSGAAGGGAVVGFGDGGGGGGGDGGGC